MWTDVLRSRYVRSLEQQIVELKAEKAEQKAEIARLQKLLVPGLRQMEREAAALPEGKSALPRNVVFSENKSPKQMDGTKIERMPPVVGWIQARDRAEYLSDSDEAKMERSRKEKS